MNSVTIHKNIKYLSEVISDFPANCIFDKGKVGAGATTIALTNSENYIVAVPFVSLIENKVAQHKSTVLGVYNITTSAKIKSYLANTETKKILVTYDSLPKLIEYIEQFGYSTKDFSLLIDEYHLLFTQYSFRRVAVKGVLDNYLKFKKYCFVTATVLQEEFILEELKHLPIVKAEWETNREVTVKSTRCQKDVIQTVVYLVNRFLNNEIEGNAYIFVNSVEFIKDLVQLCNLTNDNTRAIWSKHNKTDVGIERGSTIDEPKKINLLTSTVFEGTDIYDTEGKIYIVSDKSKSHTLVDISTSFQQIAGRIRNTKYWNTITHIYTTTRYDVNITYNEFKKHTETTINEAKSMIRQYNALDDTARKGIKEVANEYYIDKLDNNFIFDPNLVKIDLYNFKITKCLYKLRVNIQKELEQYNFRVEEAVMEAEVVNIDDLGNKFEDYIKQLKELYLSKKQKDIEAVKYIFKKYKWLKDIVNKLGYEDSFKFIAEEKYNLTNIRRKAIQLQDTNIDSKVVEQLLTYSQIQVGIFISASEAKQILKEIYNNLNIKKTAKGSDLEVYFNTKLHNKRLKNKVVKGYVIINRKM